MMQLLVRALGMIFLLAGFITGLVDGTRSIAADSVDWTSFGTSLDWLLPQGIGALRDGLSRNVHPFLWDPILVSLMPLPTLLVLVVIGGALLVLARDRSTRSITVFLNQPDS